MPQPPHGRLAKAGRLGLTLLASCAFHLAPACAQTAYGVMEPGAAQTARGVPLALEAAWQDLIDVSHDLPLPDKVDGVNRFFNRRLLNAPDSAVWQQPDHWATPREFLERGWGDCEDFAIAKYLTMQALGIGDDHLRLMYVHVRVGSTRSQAHMVLAVYPQGTDHEPVVLDNMIDSIRPLSLRSDLILVYSFNRTGMWFGNGQASMENPISSLSRWRDLLLRAQGDGSTPAPLLLTGSRQARAASARHP